MATPITDSSAPVTSPSSSSPRPQADLKETFHRHFNEEVKNVQEHIDKLDRTALVAGERQDAVDYCLASITRLTTEVQDALDFIPAYDQRAYTAAINRLKENFQEARLKFAPKSRFAFKIRKNDSALSLRDIEAEVQASDRAAANQAAAASTPSQRADQPSKNYNKEIENFRGPIRAPSFSRASSVTISEHSGLHIILPASASHATSSGSLTDLSRCIVDMSIPTANGAPFAGLALKNITSSLIVAGQVAGAAHLTNLKNTIVVVESRQVRMHDCENVDVYLRCMSRPIIEDCKNIRFAPLPECYKSKDADATEDHWNEVDDFKWLKAEHSPNWSIMPEEKRLQERVWKEVVPGTPGKGTEDILKEVGIAK